MKSGDVDPRAQVENCYTASDKAIAIGGGVLQAILEYTGVLRGVAGRNALEVEMKHYLMLRRSRSAFCRRRMDKRRASSCSVSGWRFIFRSRR